MIVRIRRWWTTCRPRSARPATPFVADMRSARAYGVVQQRASTRAIRHMGAIVEGGTMEYRELNRALFGREPWPREGDR